MNETESSKMTPAEREMKKFSDSLDEQISGNSDAVMLTYAGKGEFKLQNSRNMSFLI